MRRLQGCIAATLMLLLAGCGDDGAETTTAEAVRESTSTTATTTGESTTSEPTDTGAPSDPGEADAADPSSGSGTSEPSGDPGTAGGTDARRALVSAGFDCTEVGPYEPEPTELEMGIEVRTHFSCTKDGLGVEAAGFDSAASARSAIEIITAFSCGFETVGTDVVFSGVWAIGDAGDEDDSLLDDVAEALGTQLDSIGCDEVDVAAAWGGRS